MPPHRQCPPLGAITSNLIMVIELSLSVTESFGNDKSIIFKELSKQINQFIESEDYGNDVKEIKVGFIMVLIRPGYENWYKPKKLSYTEYKSTKSRLTGEKIEINKQLKFEIKFCESQIGRFLNSNHTEAKELIVQEIVKYLSQRNTLPKKIVDFDKERFLKDLRAFQAHFIQ